ncbi:TonB-dependent receptor [Aquimarina sp. BL5]|uniref:TonB-dependent receptor n=1 Tax=Aquimarina sp. BL5 TaxID=1714860 RepID=UPI000E4B3E21|nr:TonB-dependent receptor [Aquimarina sp. BL5]AXT49957.1 TonB-dependent receptor [Aquimarina sp. BL5]RKN07456.1 TonB-dependent receptor [Aquimarina sp. BL5]
MKKLTLILFGLFTSLGFSQRIVTGTVTDTSGLPVPFVNIVEKGSNKGTTTDDDGKYTIAVDENAVLVFSFVGFQTQEIPVGTNDKIDVVLSEGEALSTIIVVGSRSPKRTATDTPVAVDIIDMQDIVTKSGKIEINELLQYSAPSFNANKQSGSDGADHIDPASLRGLGPDQTLVLINGKRRHSSSLINIFGTRGRGNSGTDLNTIPATSIKRIEILRDGAAAQYGSDAIAGVINIVLKDNIDKLSGSISYGAYNTNAKGDFPDGTPNTDGNRLDTENDGNRLADDKSLDGGSVKVTANYGVGIGEKGYINFTTEYLSKNKTLRPGFDFRRGFGEAAIDGFNFFANASIPLSDKTELYAFGGRNYRDTDAFAFTRNGGERVVTEIYPNGFTPRITSNIIDNSISAGVRTETDNGWKIDLSNTWGKNNFHYFIEGTLNASLEENSPKEFDAGGHSLSQNTINLDFSKYYPKITKGLNLAFGAEYRTENFIIFAGEESSYATYDVNGLPITDPATQTQPIDPVSGDPRSGGSQGFPGYSPANEVDRSRSNLSLYADAELDVTDAFLIAGAARFENYSDFGSTINGKLAFRVKASDNINLRASVSTGFRAPSLAQIYYNLRFTDFQGGVATETLLSPNNSPVTASFGIDRLKEETSLNGSLGVTAKLGDFSATVDGYYIDIKDRIVLTGTFEATDFDNVNEAQFFANGVDTETVGMDVVLSWKSNYDFGTLSALLAGNVNNMYITSINTNLDTDIFFGKREQGFLLASAPRSKFALNLNYNNDKFNAGLGLTRFSDITLVDFDDNEDIYGAKITADLTVGYELTDQLKLTIGGNNITNEYPDQQDDLTEAGGYWDAVQMGFSGAYYYARLDFNF